MNQFQKPFVVGNQLWAKCSNCEQLVRLNKPLLGSLHFCLTDAEIAKTRKRVNTWASVKDNPR